MTGGRVLVVAGHATGGIGVHVRDLVGALPRHGWRPTLLTSPLTTRQLPPGPAAPDVLTPWSAGPAGPLRAARAVRGLAAAYDVVHAHGHQAGLVCAVALATLPPSRRPPLVVSWHNAVLATGPAGAVATLGERLQARRAALVTGASSDLAARARALGAVAEVAEVAAPDAVHRPADEHDGPEVRAQERAQVRAELGVPAGPLALTVSRIAPQKALDVLVAAAAAPAPAGTPVATWVVVGDGVPDLRAGLEARAARTGAPVRFVGARRDVPRLLAAADVFVLPSRWEARALVVQEALAAGVPVVATDTGGLPDLLRGAGTLVPVGDAAALRAAVDRVLADPAFAADLAARGRARAATLTTPEQATAGWAARYARLAAGAARRPGGAAG